MSSEERQARSLALEKAYVHDVYDQIAPHFTDTRYRAWPRVKQFLLDLEPASLVADVGCGNGKYLDANREAVMIGSDRCAALSEAARAKNHEVVTCDNMQLPFRDEAFDAALSVAVIHHFATTDRRVAALKELARVLRIGGKVLITVWAMEQRHRKFDSQDVLVPWHEPVKSSSEDRASSVERELTSTTTSDDDVLVYHAYSHISDNEAAHRSNQAGGGNSNVTRRRQKFRNGRNRYRSAGNFEHCNAAGNSRSSSELSSPNETCYSFVKRALQKLSSSSSTNAPYNSPNKSNNRPYFYRSCRKPWASASMEFGPNLDVPDPESSRNELYHQSSIESECPDHADEDDVPIELRHLEGYEPCMNCGSPVNENDGLDRCETHVCASCLPIDTTDSSGKKSRSLGEFFHMIPKLLRAKKCDKEPLSDLHKRISTASDPREYVVKSRGGNVNGMVRSKSTVSFMSRLEEIMSFSASPEKFEPEDSNSATQVSKSKSKLTRLPSLTASGFADGDCPVIIPETDRSTNPRRYNSPADALRKLRQDVSLDAPEVMSSERASSSIHCDGKKSAQTAKISTDESKQNTADTTKKDKVTLKSEEGKCDEEQESRLSSYYSMPELYKIVDEQVSCLPLYPAQQQQRHISFYEQAQTVIANTESNERSNEINTENQKITECSNRDGRSISITPQRALVKRSLSVDTGDSSLLSNQCPRRFSASAAQGGGVLASALRTYTFPRSTSRGSSVKSDTSVDSEESIVSVIPRKGNSITSDTSVDSEESVISVIQRSTSEIETLVRESGLRNNISRLGSRSARASPVTVLSSQTSSAESSPPQSGKNDGKFPGTGGVIDQLLQQHQMSMYSLEGVTLRQDGSDYLQRTRRSLIRPVSDSKIEDRFFSSSFDETSTYYRTTNRQASGSNRSSLESDDQIIQEEDEKCCDTTASSEKPAASTPTNNDQKNTDTKAETAELSRTPSPVGPFKYIYDPLLTDPDPMTCIENQDVTDTLSTPTKESLSSSEIADIAQCDDLQQENTTESDASDNDLPSDSGAVGYTNEENIGKSESFSETPSEAFRTGEAERHDKLRKLSQRLENLGLSSELLKSFYMSSEDSEDTFVESTDSQCLKESANEELENNVTNAAEDDSQSDTCHTENALEKSDEDSAVDESLRTVIHDVKNAVVDDSSSLVSAQSCSDSQNTNTVMTCDQLLDVAQKEIESVVQLSLGPDASDCNNEHKVITARRKLKRSCVTIDEVECREVASSDDTSPSSSASLEWNDFDKMDAIHNQPACSVSTEANQSSNVCNFQQQQGEEFMISSPEDVNVAETENKFNVFLDKEICVFFETPSSSIGKSASSSSNATDFSTTSDRIRGVVQREKSDDRSSRESDSDNLSKLSDLEPRSDSAFSEEFPRRSTDGDSVYSDHVDSHRSKFEPLQNWCDNDGSVASSSSSREKHSWILDNIDEIPDDDKENDIGKKSTHKLQRDWSDDDRALACARRGENYYNCGNNCRDVYQVNLDGSSNGCQPIRNLNRSNVGAEEGASASCGQNLPVLAQEGGNKSSDESEVPTDILAAFVETISDLTSVFGELYPRHEGKFDDVSSDDSIEISSFERILIAQEPKPVPEETEERNVESADRWFNNANKSSAPETPPTNPKVKNNHQRSANNDTSKDPSKKSNDNSSKKADSNKSSDVPQPPPLLSESNSLSKTTKNQRSSDAKPNIEKQDSEESSSVAESFKGKIQDDTKTPKKHVDDLDLNRKATAKPKLLNRSSQSVCTDKLRQDSTEDEFSTTKTQSAPCSPRLKLRQRSVEEVLSSSKAELSRNSSLSQSTSQESLPGNETGGMMAYHRYYHVFRQGELDNLIENYVENLHIIASYYDHANWCVVAEKVQVWTI